MKIPIHTLLEQLGLKDFEIKSPEDIEKFKDFLDDLIKQTEQDEENSASSW